MPFIEKAAGYGKPIPFHVGADFYETIHPYRLGHIAARLGLSSQLVTNPRFDIDEQSYYFLQDVMARSRALPWLGEFRVVLDPRFPVRVDESGVRSAARRASELRAAGTGPAEPIRDIPQVERRPTTVEVG